jgi:D-arginine dehydrogenase
LRSFLADGSPAVGFDPAHEGFFWLVGQGGYGIQSAPASGKLAAGLIREGRVPPELARHGVEEAVLGPGRFRRRSGAG